MNTMLFQVLLLVTNEKNAYHASARDCRGHGDGSELYNAEDEAATAGGNAGEDDDDDGRRR